MTSGANPDERHSIALIGAPIEVGTSEPGALMGPAALRTAGLVRALSDLGHTVTDRGDVAPDGPAGARGLEAVAGWTRALSLAVEEALGSGAIPLAAGGDHSLSLGSIDGVMRDCARRGRQLFVLWLDAHADFNTPETSPSGNVHGMPLAALCGEAGLPATLRRTCPAAAAADQRPPVRPALHRFRRACPRHGPAGRGHRHAHDRRVRRRSASAARARPCGRRGRAPARQPRHRFPGSRPSPPGSAPRCRAARPSAKRT